MTIKVSDLPIITLPSIDGGGGGGPTGYDPAGKKCCLDGECSSSKNKTKCYCPPICFAFSQVIFEVLPVIDVGPAGPDDYIFTGLYDIIFNGCIYVAGRSKNGGTLEAVIHTNGHGFQNRQYPDDNELFEMIGYGGSITQDFHLNVFYVFGSEYFTIEVRCLENSELCARKNIVWDETKTGENGFIAKIKSAEDDVPTICEGFGLFEGPYEQWNGMRSVCGW